VIELSAIELDFLWEARNAGDLPYPLELRSHGATMDERETLRRRVHEGLRDRGLLDLTGGLERRLDGWLGVLARPSLSIDSVFLPGFDAEAGPVAEVAEVTEGADVVEPVRALAATNGSTAILATQHGAGLTLRPIDRHALVSTIVDLLPPGRRGTELSISLPTDEFAAAAAGQARTGERAGGRADDRATSQAVARLTSLPSTGGGQIAANSRSELTGRRRSTVLAWFDNESGRYLGQVRAAGDGRDWTTVAPADAATLRKRISEMMAEVTS
jgi:hypothetical protein